MTYVGLIYGYPRPDKPGEFDYIGQTQGDWLQWRHARHLKEKSKFDVYLRSLPAPTEPIELLRIEYEDKEKWLLALMWCEIGLIFEYKTYRQKFPEYGGWNFALPGLHYHHDAGVLGGKRRVELHGNPATYESCAKGGRLTGPLTGGKNFRPGDASRGGKIGGSRVSREDHSKAGRLGGLSRSEKKIAACRKNALKGGNRTSEHCRKAGKKAAHTIHHVKRDIKNPNCEFCQ